MANKFKFNVRVYSLCWTIFGYFIALATGISLKNVSIPHYGVKDGTIQLLCDFDIESDHLVDLKWYKNEAEFFRYIPTGKVNMLTFSVEGVHVDISHSSLKLVTLKNITLKTSGLYKCEILADKSFRTLSDQGYMIVIAPPQYDPEINVEQTAVSVGERVRGNCTSHRSKPAASLMFYINAQKPDFADITEFLPINETGGLETSKLGFNFLVEPHHFSNSNSRIELKCTATIGNYYAVTTSFITETKITAQPSSERNRLSSDCSRNPILRVNPLSIIAVSLSLSVSCCFLS